MSLEQFTSKRCGSKRKSNKMSKGMRSFYKSQDDLINEFEEIRLDVDDAMENAETIKKLRKKASIYAKSTFFVNLVLLAIKVVAVVLSGSISLISSLVDSAVDLISGVVIWVTTRAVKNTDRYVYPQGRTKLEPMSIVILSVIMSVASLQIIKESFTKIVGLSDNSSDPPIMDWTTIGIASATVVVKLILFILCRRVPHPTVQALALDHRNDVLSNFAAIVFGYIGSQEMQGQVSLYGLVYLDPTGAIVISIYIIANWCITGWDQIKLLVGHTATGEFISKVTWICMDHHKKVQKVDTVKAFHFGNNFLVEADIVLPPEMTLREAHDIAEPLQQKLERLPEVERAFVHVDYEYTHHPASEHKITGTSN
ncbi:MTP5-like protein [Mya arenaria]|uniref:MTP5-like protein n=1 Tax=Mya arenaria TaxID=6604 RepID=A0ABY7F173_MYAAR|nr:MTP5-like protein [Mya arenaria]